LNPNPDFDIMPDQAEHLRNLAQAATPLARPKPGGKPLVVVTGCKAGVGATTVAVNVAAVLSDRGLSVILVDAAGERSNMMEIAGVRSSVEFTLADVLARKCEVADAAMSGPCGVKLFSARGRSSARSKSASWRDAAAGKEKELLIGLKSLPAATDVIVIDTGAGLSRIARCLWLRAQLVLLVTATDDAAVMDAYAATKRHMAGVRGATCDNIRLLVNRAEDDRLAADTHRRFATCCQRFLRQKVAALPALPRWDVRDSVERHPRVWDAPNSEFGHSALWLGRAVANALRVEDAECRIKGVGVSALSASRVHNSTSF